MYVYIMAQKISSVRESDGPIYLNKWHKYILVLSVLDITISQLITTIFFWSDNILYFEQI